jgi:hypothetical protein
MTFPTFKGFAKFILCGGIYTEMLCQERTPPIRALYLQIFESRDRTSDPECFACSESTHRIMAFAVSPSTARAPHNRRAYGGEDERNKGVSPVSTLLNSDPSWVILAKRCGTSRDAYCRLHFNLDGPLSTYFDQFCRIREHSSWTTNVAFPRWRDPSTSILHFPILETLRLLGELPGQPPSSRSENQSKLSVRDKGARSLTHSS